MNNEKRDAVIAELENDIEVKKKEIKAKEVELSELKMAKIFETINIKDLQPGNIITIKGLWGLDNDNMMKIEQVKIDVDRCEINLIGCGFKNVVAMAWSTTEIEDNWSINLCANEFGVNPKVEIRTIDEWNEAIDGIINKVSGMKC